MPDDLVASQSEFDQIQVGLDILDQGITIFDRDLVLVFVNKKCLKLLDVPASILCRGNFFSDIMRYNAQRGEYGLGPVDDLVAERTKLARKFRSHNIERTRPNGTVLRVSGHPLPNGGFATIYTDITRERRREIALQSKLDQHTADLRRNEERLSLIANELPAGIAYLDHNAVFRYANTRFAKAHNLTPESIDGLACDEVLMPETLAAVERYFAIAKAGKSVDFDLKVDLPNRRTIEVRTILRPDKHSRGFYLMSINIGKYKQATSLLLQSQKMEALGQLSNGVAHDFNNLLMVILSNLIPLEDKIDEALASDMLLPAIRAARQGADLTKRLLTVACGQSLEPTSVDLEAIIGNLTEIVDHSIPDRIELNFSTPDKPIWVFADRAQLEAVLLNLTINARNAINGLGRISIELTRQTLSEHDAHYLQVKPGDFVEILFSDDGVGISAAVLKRIFEPFFTTKSQGSGLGLALVYSFVQGSGGVIDVESELGIGTTIRILLPASEPLVLSADEAEVDPDPNHSADSQLILLVEDDKDIRKIIRRDLVDLGYNVVEGGTAEEALNLLALLENVSLVLSDIAMPTKLSGIDLSIVIRQKCPHIPVILMTGHGVALFDNDTNSRALCVLHKPFSKAALAQRVAVAISEAKK